MQEKVEILINGNGPISVELLSEFEINDGGNKKRYILLTNNDIDQNGLIKILASEINGGQISRIESEDDWAKVKNVMRSIISSSPETITYINTSENKSFNANENYARVIAVQDSAKQAISKDYFEKRPSVDVPELMEPTQIEDPNSSIYPNDNTIAPIGTEVANGISEAPNINPAPQIIPPVEDEDAPINNYENTPTSNYESTDIDAELDKIKEQLVKEITEAVDKYVENIKLNLENKELKSVIEQLNKKLNS